MEPKKANEFKRYRQVLAAVYLTTVATGFTLLATSVAKQLFFHPRVALDGPALSADHPDPQDLLACNQRVTELYEELGDTTTELMSGPPHGVRRPIYSAWEAFGRRWTQQWHQVNQRCRFEELAGSGMSVAYDRMARVHADLRAMRLKYQSLLVRFDEEQADELRQMKQALDRSRQTLQALVDEQAGSASEQSP